MADASELLLELWEWRSGVFKFVDDRRVDRGEVEDGRANADDAGLYMNGIDKYGEEFSICVFELERDGVCWSVCVFSLCISR